MRFDELPADIQLFLDGKPEGYYRFPGLQDDMPANVFPFSIEILWGPLSSTLLISPIPQHLTDAPGTLPFIGFGRGFERLKDPIVLESEAATTSRLIADGGDHRDPQVEFHSFSMNTFVCTDRVFRILLDNGALQSNMWRELYQEAAAEITPISWKIIDFPRTPIIDYAKSEALWKVSAQYRPGSSDFDRLNYTVEFSAHKAAHWTRPECALPPIGRDTLCNQMFVKRQMLLSLRDETVIGPDYRFFENSDLS